MWVELVDENSDPSGCSNRTCSNAYVNPAVVLGWAPLSAPTGASGAWTGSLIPGAPSTNTTPGSIAFTSTDSQSTGSFPAGLRVVTSSYPTATGQPPNCPQEFPTAANPEGVVCYDIGEANPSSPSDTDSGALFTRVYANPSGHTPGVPTGTVSSPKSPAAPQAGDVWLVPYTGSTSPVVDECGSTEGTKMIGSTVTDVSNFTSGQSTVQLCANMTFTSTGGTSVACSSADMDLYVNPTALYLSSSTPNMNCPSAGPNGVWYSDPVPLTNSVNAMVTGPTNFSLDWTLSTGNVPTEYTSSGTAVDGAVGLIGGQQPYSGDSTTGYQIQRGTATPCTSGDSGQSCNCTKSNPCYCSATYPCACSAGQATCESTTCTTTYVCSGSFDGSSSGSGAAEIVQRGFDGAANQYDASFSRAGPITGLALTNSNGVPVQSVARGTSEALNVSVTLIPSFKDDSPAEDVGPVALNAGDDDFSGEWDCYSPTWSSDPATSSGSSSTASSPQAFNLEMQWWIEEGCNSDHITTARSTSLPQTSPPIPSVAGAPSSSQYYWYKEDPNASTTGPPSCDTASIPPTQANPDDCVEGVEDNDITWNVMAALNESVLGCTDAQCSTSTPICDNYWNTNNSLFSLLDNGTNDPRLVTLPLTEYGAMYPNSYAPTPFAIPIIGFAEFYITGWWGDPCTSSTVETLHHKNTTLSNGTTLVPSTDDSPPDDIDAAENGSVDEGSYSEDRYGNGTGGMYTGCSSTSPGYDTTVSTKTTAFCTDQGLLLGHFVQDVEVSGGVAGTTPCTSSTLGLCIAVLNK